jgi:hypothetical protein
MTAETYVYPLKLPRSSLIFPPLAIFLTDDLVQRLGLLALDAGQGVRLAQGASVGVMTAAQ